MSEHLEPPKKLIEKTHEPAAELQEKDLEEAHRNSVPIISDKEIEAIFVGGVPAEADETFLQETFQKYGPIKTVKIINSVKTSKVSSISIKPKRFAIVTFGQPIQSTILVSEHWILGRKVDVKEYLSGEEANNKLNREKRRKVFVGGLPLTVNNETLKSYFEQFGKVLEANIVYNHETMRSRGFGFVIFQDEKTVQEILKRYDDHYLYGKWIECKPALLKDEVAPDAPGPQHQQQQMMMMAQQSVGQHMHAQRSGPPQPRAALNPKAPPQHLHLDEASDKKSGSGSADEQDKQPAGKKKQLKDDRKQRNPEDDTQPDGSDSQKEGQGGLGYFEYPGYGMVQPPAYNYQGYNYHQLPPPHGLAAQGYPPHLYPGSYPPQLGYDKLPQRPLPPRQYPPYPAYNYQDRLYPQAPGLGGPVAADYYEEYNYGDEHRTPVQGHPYPLAPQPHAPAGKRGKAPAAPDRQLQSQGQYSGYQYGAQPPPPMYPPHSMTAHYDAPRAYEYYNYKPAKTGEPAMHAGHQNYYNYKGQQTPYPQAAGFRPPADKSADFGEEADEHKPPQQHPHAPREDKQQKKHRGGKPQQQQQHQLQPQGDFQREAKDPGQPGPAGHKQAKNSRGKQSGNMQSQMGLKQFAEDMPKKSD